MKWAVAQILNPLKRKMEYKHIIHSKANLEEMDYPQKHQLPKLKQDETDNLKNSTHTKKKNNLYLK